ncbi:MAG: hypothetical protein PHY02_08185 [Phycisphaerae bacterium]|nr:hypothetical protein [Phycisphaerae bacterium]
MKQNIKSGSGRGNRLLSRLAAEKKRAFVAAFLIIVMVFMWARVLGKKGPQSANAAIMKSKLIEEIGSELKISFIELPKVNGRNDVLTKDFFAVESWNDFMQGGRSDSENVDSVSENASETIKSNVRKLKLEAIVLGENPRAFINDKLLSVGDKLFVGDGADMCECKVTKIEENIVFIKCGETEITLRLAQTAIIGY